MSHGVAAGRSRAASLITCDRWQVRCSNVDLTEAIIFAFLRQVPAWPYRDTSLIRNTPLLGPYSRDYT